MKLTVFNGSPRGKNSNTRILLDHFLEGFMTTGGNSYELAYLVNSEDHGYSKELFEKADHILLAFPLYFDSMPSNVKYFIELLEPFSQTSDNPAIGFFVQSGFPEPGHSRYLERYLKKFAGRMNCVYKVTVIRGGVEALKIVPILENFFQKFIVAVGNITNIGGVGYFFNTKRLFGKFYRLGITYGKTGEYDMDIINQLAKPERLTRIGFLLFKSVAENFYWNNLLKKNNAMHKRFRTPYTD